MVGWLFFGICLVIFSNGQSVQGFPRSSKSNSSTLTHHFRTNEPVIGILTQEATGKITQFGTGQYVLSTYVNTIEAAGGRVVPFLINQSPQQVEKMFNSINGVVFPGGHVKLQYSKYGSVGKQIYELAKKANDKGSVFPIWAECLGLELIALLASGRGLANGQYDTALFNYTYSKKLIAPLTITKEYKNSHLFGRLPPEMFEFMTTRMRSWHNHNKAILPVKYKEYKPLMNMFRILSTNKDKKGVEFISTLEGRKYPFFLLHWHPTKAPYAHSNREDNSQEAVANAQFLTNVFLNLARMSDHMYKDPNEKNRALIRNYQVTSTNKEDAYFMPM